MDPLFVAMAVAVVLLVAVVVWLATTVFGLRSKYGAVIDIDDEVERGRSELQRQAREHSFAEEKSKHSLGELEKQYVSARNIYERLKKEVSLLEENLEDLSFGLYRPHYDFEDPEQFKEELDRIYEAKKQLIRKGLAVHCPQEWHVNGDRREGAKMIKNQAKLMLRAFNGEVDAAVAKVTWNNSDKMEERIRKSFQSVNDFGSVTRTGITNEYLNLSLSEMRLSYELERKKQEIKEEQRRIREQMREEEQAQREFERAKKAAEAEEARYQKALVAARAEMEKAKASEMAKIEEKIAGLEAKLEEAQHNVQRAVSMAQLTKSGHVYVISNIGSFGENVFKIGMTRRLDPTERVDELGSASVPFPYDIHAMIYSVDAPSLEHAFHREFSERRVNAVNARKEFFDVSLEELRVFALTHNADIEFTELAEAREYRETKALRLQMQNVAIETGGKEDSFPESLIGARRE